MHYLKGFFIRLSLRSCNVVDLCYPLLHTALGCSTSVLVFGCWPMKHVTYLKLRKNLNVVTSWANTQNGRSCHYQWKWLSFCQLLQQHLFSSQLEISHVLNGTTPGNQHRNRGPYKIVSQNCKALQNCNLIEPEIIPKRKLSQNFQFLNSISQDSVISSQYQELYWYILTTNVRQYYIIHCLY